MKKLFRIRLFGTRSDSLKAKTCTELSRKWVGVVAIGLAFALFGAVAQAQQPTKIPRIGYVSSTGDANNPGRSVEAFRQGLRDLGYHEGKNIVVEYRYTEGRPGSIPSFVAELLQLKVDVLVSPTSPGIRAAKQASSTI